MLFGEVVRFGSTLVGTANLKLYESIRPSQFRLFYQVHNCQLFIKIVFRFKFSQIQLSSPGATY